MDEAAKDRPSRTPPRMVDINVVISAMIGHNRPGRELKRRVYCSRQERSIYV
jgi:hypothetical protein